MDKHKLKEIEERDAEIARLIHKQEQLKKAKRDKERQLRKEAKGKGAPVVSGFDYVKEKVVTGRALINKEEQNFQYSKTFKLATHRIYARFFSYRCHYINFMICKIY